MLAQFELTPARAEALAKLEKDTGESRSALLNKALDNLIEQRREFEELAAEVEQAQADFEAGRVHSSAEVMANAMAAIARAKARKATA